jgi:hypothetical protein
MLIATPPWINPNQGVPLSPPAVVLKLGALPRAPENLIALPNALHILTAKRYAPVRLPNGTLETWCNIFVADACTILRKPILHRLDLRDGKGVRELRANDIVDGLRRQVFPGWSMTGTMASAEAVKVLASEGRPQVAVWKNPTGGPGHVMLVLPTPPGRSEVWVAGAGAQCHDGCPIANGFGPYTYHVEFYAADE